MKKALFIISLAMLIMFASQNKAFAQTPINVIQGTSHSYSVTPVPNGANYEYHWSVTGGTSSTFSSANNSGSIVWDGATGQYTITVYATNPVTGCNGNNQTLIINVVSMGGFTLTGPASVCPKTDNQTGDFTVSVAYSGTGAWSFTLNDGLVDKVYNVASGVSSFNVDVPGYANLSSTTVATHVFKLVSVTTPEGTVNYDGTEANATSHTISVNVQPTPATSGITQN
jgi:hypothetical protein